MSRIGNRILTLPQGVTLTTEGNKVIVKGPKGELSTEVNKHIKVEVNGNELKITRDSDLYKNFHGTANANINNMIINFSRKFAFRTFNVNHVSISCNSYTSWNS